MRNELTLIFSKDIAYADSRVIAKCFGKTLSHVTRDVKRMIEELDPDKSKNGFAYRVKTYVNPSANGKVGVYYELDFDMTMTLITGYDVKLRHNIIKQWHRLVEERSAVRNCARQIRNDFTDTLSEHGYTKRYEYINTTKAMKKPFGITASKPDMTESELTKITAAEYLAKAMLTDERGYREVNPVCVDASNAVVGALAQRKQRRIA